MTDHGHHEDHHEDHDEDTMPPQPSTTETFPRARRNDPAAEPTRLDAHQLWDVADPTREVRVSPIGVHTRGSAATTPPHPPAVETLNALLDDQARIAADTRRAWTNRPLFRTDRHKARTVREEAARRARQKLRHERHMEMMEVVRTYLAAGCLLVLFLLVVGMAWIAVNIALGAYTWGPTHP